MKCSHIDDLGQYDCILIVTDRCDYDYRRIVGDAQFDRGHKERDQRNRVSQVSQVLEADLIWLFGMFLFLSLLVAAVCLSDRHRRFKRLLPL
jgi:hypothetical protein